MERKHFFLFGIFLLLLNDANAATTIDDGAFGTIWDALVTWVQGSLGYTIALLGMLGTMIFWLIGADKFLGGGGKFFVIGILISLIAGGLVGITTTMFGLGAGTFN